ncbi:MAG TPA: hypothetical protein VGH38_01130 [Bryobacteraceae bacterium]
MNRQPGFFHGSLDSSILRTFLIGAEHRHAIVNSVLTTSQDLLQVATSSLYPALHRPVWRKYDEPNWESSDTIVTIAIAVLVAGFAPARRASRIDPVIALRSE